MLERSPDSSKDENATQLFAEYLARREAGEALEVEALCARAGANAEELRRRIRALAVLDDLGDALREDDREDDHEDGAQGATAGAAAIPRLGPYENLRLLGEGGLSRVYVAFDPGLQREVALKVIANEQIPRGAAHDWMLREGRSVARLQHKNVVRIFALGQTDDAARTYVAMELVDGPSLADVRDELRARRHGGVPASKDPRVLAAADRYAGIGARAGLALSIARALAACHAADVLHRDVKPGNVLIDADGEPKLIDFGLAHLSQDGPGSQHVTQRLIGTPAYIAPEQVESGMTGADPRSDQFSFGVLLYELLALEAPFQRGTRTQTMDAVARALPAAPRELDPAIPADLETICLHALEREPGDRYPSMDALADDLEAFLDHRAIAISGPSIGRKFRLWARRHRRDLLVAAVPLALALVGSLAAVVHGVTDEAERVDVALQAARDGVAALDTPTAFELAIPAAEELRARATALDGSLLARVALTARAPAADRLIDKISERLSQVMASGWASNARAAGSQRTQLDGEWIGKWQRALALETRAAPDAPWNRAERARGSVRIAEPEPGTRLHVYEHVSLPAPFQVAWSRVASFEGELRSGTFRVALADDDGRVLSEIDLNVPPAAPQRLLELRPADSALRASMIEVAASKGSAQFGATRAFRVLPGWMTLREARAVRELHPEIASLLSPNALEPSAGADPDLHPRLFLVDVLILAEALGLRLPTGAEAVALIAATRDARDGLAPLPPGFTGEYLTGRRIGGVQGAIVHPIADELPRLSEIQERSRPASGAFAFRFVCSSQVED